MINSSVRESRGDFGEAKPSTAESLACDSTHKNTNLGPFPAFVLFVLFVVEKSGFQLDSQHAIFVVKGIRIGNRPN